jgi:hypothetical protein
MRNSPILFCVLALLLLSSCQKELTEEGGAPTFCNVASITVKNGGGNVIELYEYEYDSVSRRPTRLRYQNFEAGTSKIVTPVYSADTVYLGLNTYLTVDASKRIKKLSEFDPPQGLIEGDYYFTYNSNGQLTERLIDDGVNDAYTTSFNYNNNNLVNFSEDVPGFPQPIPSTVAYGSSPELKAYTQYALLELFPELLLYMPTLQLGKISPLPIATVESTLELPGSPLPVTVTTTYDNYTLTQEGWLSTFQSKTVAGGSTVTSASYQFQYRCFN